MTVAAFSPNLFWDVDPSTISMEDNSAYIIQRALEYGQMNDWRLLNQYYGLNRIVNECKQMRTLDPVCLSFICTISHKPLLHDMRLVGGTSLALQYGHRRSVDLDFFGHTTEDVDELTNMLSSCAKDVVRGNCTKSIKAYFLNNIKVDIVNYQYRWIDEPVICDGLRLASPKDIAAMKVNAVMGRGTKKDFVDMYFLLRHYTFDEIMQFYLQKYPDGSEYRALLSMTYFADADPQPMPHMFQQVEWNTIKEEVKHQVERYNQSITGQ